MTHIYTNQHAGRPPACRNRKEQPTDTVFKRKNIPPDEQGAASAAPASAFGAEGASVPDGTSGASAPASSPASAPASAAPAATPVPASGDGRPPASGASPSAPDGTSPKKRRRPSLSTVLIALVLIAGIGIFCYPAVSDWWNSLHATRAITAYQETVAALTDEERAQLMAQAREYNAHLDTISDRFGGAPAIHDEYEQALDVTGDGLIGYVTIDKIDVLLPIYHGTEEGTLQTSAGHLEGSHLPTGDVGNHVVVSAHRGLPSAILFTYLDELHEGDHFSITVLDDEMIYQVDQVLIVEPAQIEALLPEDDADLATLQTCTPYGVNSHRLLVRGHRVDSLSDDLAVERDARRVPIHIMAPAVAVPILLVVLVGLLIASRRKPARVTEEDLRAVSLAPEVRAASRAAAHEPGKPGAPDAPADPSAPGAPADAPAPDAPVEDPDARREHHER